MLIGPQARRRDPRRHGLSGLVGEFELDGPLRLALHHYGPRRDMAAGRNVLNSQPNEVTPAQLAVDGQVEQGEVPEPVPQLQANADGLNLPRLQRRLLTKQFAAVPRGMLSAIVSFHGGLLSS
jgi:hypothetical protein